MSSSKSKRTQQNSGASQSVSDVTPIESQSNEPTTTPEPEEQTLAEDGSTSSEPVEEPVEDTEVVGGPETAQNDDGALGLPDDEFVPETGIQGPSLTTSVPTGTIGSVPEGHIIRAGEEITIKATQYGNIAIADVDHYKERRLRGSQRSTYVLLYSAGAAIPLNALTEKN